MTTFMRIVLLTNAASGKGGSHALASGAADALARAGHEVERVALARGWEAKLGDAALLIACGGDGTASACASVLSGGLAGGLVGGLVGGQAGGHVRGPTNGAARATALYHLPRGTENLFAREFGMRPDIDRLLEAVGQWRVERVDVGTWNGGDGAAGGFVLMCSVGFDADVLVALAARRRGPISHGSYVRPVIECLLRPTIRTLTIEVDGRTVVDGVMGNAVVSNCGRYALGIDPSRDASMTDGQLDLFFSPSASSARTIVWMGLALARMGRNARSIVRARGRRVTIHTRHDGAGEQGATRFQVDGEAMSTPGATIELGVRAGVLPVLLATRD